MRHFRTSVPLISLTLALAWLLPAHAARFSDVPSSHPFATSIEALAEAKVILGNPDGTFAPAGKVNRAALLIMLYRSRNWTPAAPSASCKKDVVHGSWYEAVVCDAIQKGFVAGYEDGTFKPEREVSRAEALKMTQAVLGLAVPSVTIEAMRDVRYTDVLSTAWYAKYVLGALKNGILPISGQDGSQLKPDTSLLRGEAAAYIHGALKTAGMMPQVSAQTSSAPKAASSAPAAATSSRPQWDTSALDHPVILDVEAVFADDGVFQKKISKAYHFTVKKTTTIRADVSTTKGSVTCRLYKLEQDGTSVQYYLGWDHETGKCWMRVTLAPGEWQMEIAPTLAGADYKVRTASATGDGNDGFAAAKLLDAKVSTSFLETDDSADWYTFTVAAKKTMTIELTNAERLACIVYAMADVDLYGFEQPECNAAFDFPPGTYVVGVTRGDSELRQDFAIRLK